MKQAAGFHGSQSQTIRAKVTKLRIGEGANTSRQSRLVSASMGTEFSCLLVVRAHQLARNS